MIKVGFDLFDTILNSTETHKKLRERNVDYLIAKKFNNNISKELFYKYVKQTLRDWRTNKFTEYKTGALVKTVFEKCNVPIPQRDAEKIHEEYLERFFKEVKINPILCMIINICQKNKIDMFLLSNATDKEIQLFKKNFSKINKSIKELYYSENEGVNKREDIFYEKFFKKFNIEPGNFIYFGNDNYYDGKITKFGSQYISVNEFN